MQYIVIALRTLDAVLLITVIGCLLLRAIRAWTANTQPRDFEFFLFCALAVNRLWFLIRGIYFGSVLDMRYEGASLVACYLWAIACEAGVIMSWRWQRAAERRVSEATA